MPIVLLIVILFSSLPSLAGVSAYRPANMPWEEMAQKMRPSPSMSFRGTAVGSAKPLPEVQFTKLTRWKNFQQILQRFQKLRDLRFIPEPLHAKTMRRSTWLYPDDGCYARAALMKDNIQKMGFKAPTKIFVYGDLSADTPNTPSGVVSWWYHVALIVTDGIEKYVLDPSLEAKQPLPLQKWLQRMGNPNLMKISLCAPSSYMPFSPCQTPNEAEDETAMDDQTFFLSMERYRLEELGRNADEELGDHPPWML